MVSQERPWQLTQESRARRENESSTPPKDESQPKPLLIVSQPGLVSQLRSAQRDSSFIHRLIHKFLGAPAMRKELLDIQIYNHE